MSSEEEWQRAKEIYAIGSRASGMVVAHRSFGFFVKLDKSPTVMAFVDIVSYNPQGLSLGPSNWPKVGEPVEGVVADLVDRDHQVRLRVGPAH
ncbi:hypothetical protein ACH4TE_26705 [Streptomyces sioyaensis]|uniref:hypothetical protein n=1 Tax=Streptomyces sioyaensis TaxID=67364 RepID=UPI0037B9A3A3